MSVKIATRVLAGRRTSVSVLPAVLTASLPAVLTASLPAVLTASLPAAIAARRLAGRLARLLRELALGVAGLLGGSGAVERARLAVELAGAG